MSSWARYDSDIWKEQYKNANDEICNYGYVLSALNDFSESIPWYVSIHSIRFNNRRRYERIMNLLDYKDSCLRKNYDDIQQVICTREPTSAEIENLENSLSNVIDAYDGYHFDALKTPEIREIKDFIQPYIDSEIRIYPWRKCKSRESILEYLMSESYIDQIETYDGISQISDMITESFQYKPNRPDEQVWIGKIMCDLNSTIQNMLDRNIECPRYVNFLNRVFKLMDDDFGQYTQRYERYLYRLNHPKDEKATARRRKAQRKRQRNKSKKKKK